MYRLKVNDERLTFCEEPRYIKVNPTSGCFIQATPEDAQGIAVFGQPYNLPGHTEITHEVFTPTEGGQEGEGTVSREIAPEIEFERVDEYQFLATLEDKDFSQDDEITNVELALCDSYEASETKNSSQDDEITNIELALCDVYEALLG